MRFGDLFQLSLQNLWRTRLRSLLTTLGVVIGIGVLVSMVSFATGVQERVTHSVRELDLFTSFQVTAGGDALGRLAAGSGAESDNPLLTDEAVDRIRQLPGVALAFPELRIPVTVRFRGREEKTTIRALPAAMAKYPPYDELAFGRFFEADDEMTAVVSQAFLNELGVEIEESFDLHELEASGRDDPLSVVPADSVLGTALEVATSVLDEEAVVRRVTRGMAGGGVPLRESTLELAVVGLAERRSAFATGNLFSAGVIVPLETAKAVPRLGISSVWDLVGRSSEQGYASVYVRAEGIDEMAGARAAVEEMGYSVIAIADRLDEFRREFLILEALLGSIGTVALIIAALGIVNTMVTSILERTREIGVMKAIGGSEGQIRAIFLVEAGTIGAFGGVFGNALGWAVSRLANVIANSYVRPYGYPSVELFSLPIWLAFGAFGFALAVSLAAGVYPAFRAARVDPARALRHD